MKSAWVVAVLVCVVLTSAAHCQMLGTYSFGNAGITPRAMGMGGAGIGVADDAAAWYQNPAGLGVLNIPCPTEDKEWAADIVGFYADGGSDADGFGLTASGWKPASMWGLGAGILDVDYYGKILGAGFGSNYKDSKFSWGVSIVDVQQDIELGDDVELEQTVIIDDHDTRIDDTIFNLGFMYRFEQPDKAPIRLGLLVEDITDESDAGPFFSVGVAWPAAPQWLVAVDVVDVTDETDEGPYFNLGAEYAFANSPFKARAGLADTGDGHDLTLGAGYTVNNRWRVDASWQNADEDDIWSIGAGVTF